MQHYYTPEELKFIEIHIKQMTWEKLTVKFNQTFNADLNSKALSATGKRYSIKSGRTGFFPKGSIPFNKGKKGTGGWEPTQFKEGHRPANWRPIGSERLSKDGYIEVKVQDGMKQKNWRGKHIVVWEEHNGPLPKGHAVIFGDRDTLNFDPDNLILVSRKQLLRLNQNSLIQNDADLTRTGIIIVDIYNKIGERKKATHGKESHYGQT